MPWVCLAQGLCCTEPRCPGLNTHTSTQLFVLVTCHPSDQGFKAFMWQCVCWRKLLLPRSSVKPVPCLGFVLQIFKDLSLWSRGICPSDGAWPILVEFSWKGWKYTTVNAVSDQWSFRYFIIFLWWLTNWLATLGMVIRSWVKWWRWAAVCGPLLAMTAPMLAAELEQRPASKASATPRSRSLGRPGQFCFAGT